MDPDSASTPSVDSLGVVSDAVARADQTLALAARYLDPSLVDVLRILGFDTEYTSARGSYLYDAAGRAYLDFHTGEGFASLGHNHPDVREVLGATLAADLADGVQLHYSVLAGMLAEALSRRLPRGLDATWFASTGGEAVDTAMKFARAATGRPRLISCERGFHGVSMGPLSLVGDEFFKEGFGPFLPGCARVPFGDLDRLEAELRHGDVALFIVEPIQGRQVTVPGGDYLRGAQELCRRYGTLFALDEIQTGLGRTGRWFALEHWGLEPDFVLIGKALSGGYMPIAATVTRREIFQKAVGTLERSYVHQSTYGRNRLSMAAGLATLRVMERDGLVERAEVMGQRLRDGITELGERYEMLKEVRGRGLMVGIELGAPNSRVAKLNWRLIHLASEGLFPQLVVIPLHRDHGVITMASGKNDVIKLLPPLTVSESEVQSFLEALDSVLADLHGAASKNWAVVRDIATATLRRRASSDDQVADSTGFRGTAVDPSREDVCLVSGATGFIGGRLTQRLVQEGYQVRCLVRPTSDTTMLDQLPVEIAVGDLTRPSTLGRAAEGCTYVLHCGALVSDWALAAEIEGTNVAGTRNLLEAAAGASVQRFVHFSTTDVYGYPGGAAIDESHAASGFRNWYAQSKLRAEAEVRRVERAHPLDTVILRPATVYGPGSTDVVGGLARAIRGGNMVLIDGGRAIAGLCYVDNLVDAALLALRHERAPGQAFNVSDGLPITWKQFTDGLAQGLGVSEVRWSVPYPVANGIGFSLEHGYRLLRRTTRLRTPPLVSRQAVHVLGTNQDFSNRKARELLAWEPRVDYQAGLDATVQWLRGDHLKRAHE
ncbi:MAG TPA: aminotransferase class III-fold pyridoxal phosphate-dependent enzyme [Solirubrobacteraceae bacterium]|jgi:acetylornithine/succinyldiaminopimelate/putrescine aminotransferase/nucleoside-diphosphate-sugar epimerase|nr:aminotransferase class III-fold pyridoxal phosphate-dependent enzyme [Solirubrobacteraceae bacterium]